VSSVYPPSEGLALELRKILKRFGTLTALDHASLQVRRGTVHALLGENGAGKTTLMHVAYGMVAPDGGAVLVRGRLRSIKSPQNAIAAGLGMVHQHFTLVPTMSVQENLALGGRGRLSRDDMRERVERVAHNTGFVLDPDALVGTLPVGAQQRVEIAKALARDASLLILDEPTAVLAPSEIAELLSWLREYVRTGNAAVLITHKLREALSVADDVTVLREGRVVLTARVCDVTEDVISAAMMGAITHIDHGHGARGVRRIVFDVQDMELCDHDDRVRVSKATFTVREGELVGIAGVEGAGHHELLRALAGRLQPTAGSLVKPLAVGFVPEDRHEDAILLDRSLTENVALRDAADRRGRMPWHALGAQTNRLIAAFDVRTPSADAPMRGLSGGNQQRLVIARELEYTGPGAHALVVENPTRGLDVRATADVHRRLLEACDAGAAVVLYSSDVDEILGLASRVLVLYAGTLRELPLDSAAIGRAMIGLG
jgi:simple sugar transport system ATP-binding protein